MTITVRKWGNSLGVRIPKSVAQNAKVESGTEMHVSVEGGRIVLRPAAHVPTLRQLLARIKPGSQPRLVDWGKPVGNEVW